MCKLLYLYKPAINIWCFIVSVKKKTVSLRYFEPLQYGQAHGPHGLCQIQRPKGDDWDPLPLVLSHPPIHSEHPTGRRHVPSMFFRTGA